jgi:hypothetical protein
MLKSLVRPVYRRFVERRLWWFLAILKRFFLDDIAAKIDDIDRRLKVQESAIERLAADRSNAAQWDAIEQLILALFQHSESRSQNPDWEVRPLDHQAPTSGATESYQVNASNNLR